MNRSPARMAIATAAVVDAALRAGRTFPQPSAQAPTPTPSRQVVRAAQRASAKRLNRIIHDHTAGRSS